MYRKILVPIDGSACSDEAVAEGAKLAKSLGSEVTLLYAMDVNPMIRDSPYSADVVVDALRKEAQSTIEPARRAARELGVEPRVEIVEGEPSVEIARRSETFDLVVMGSHGKGVVKRALFGSVAQAVLHRVHRPVLVVRCSQAAEAFGVP